MLPDWLYTKGVPGLNEAILAADYADISRQELSAVIDQIKSRRVLGTIHNGVWYVEAPPFCEDALKSLHGRRHAKSQRPAEIARAETRTEPDPSNTPPPPDLVKDFFKPDSEVDFQYALREETFSRNFEKAAWLYQKAANQGHYKAKYFLAVMYLEGRGVTKNINKAIQLLTDSSSAGYDKAVKLLSEVNAKKYE